MAIVQTPAGDRDTQDIVRVEFRPGAGPLGEEAQVFTANDPGGLKVTAFSSMSTLRALTLASNFILVATGVPEVYKRTS